jgi:hypothetical protein
VLAELAELAVLLLVASVLQVALALIQVSTQR